MVVILLIGTTSTVFAADPEKDASIISKATLTTDDWKYIDSLPLEQKQNLLTERLQNIKQEPTLREVAAINNMSEAEFVAFCKQQQKDAEDLMKNGAARFAQDKQNMDELFKRDPEAAKMKYSKMFSENIQTSNNTGMRALTGGPIGTYGDVLVTFGINSMVGITGHAAIVSQMSSWTIEAWPGAFSPIGLEGVQWYPNNWGSYSQTWGLGVLNATVANYTNAAIYAQNQVSKPFNWNIFNKFTTNSFYCSQLCWRSWEQQGKNIDGMPYDTVVYPWEIPYDNDIFIYYYQP